MFELSAAWYAIVGSVLVAAVSSLVGSMLVLQRRSLLVDMLGHAVFPGVILGFLLAGWQRSAGFFFFGAVVAITVGYLLFVWLARDQRVGDDAATAIALSGMFALGATLLSWIQQHALGAQAGLNTFLTGQAALIAPSDVIIFALLFLVIVVFFVINLDRLKVWAFDEGFATVTGFRSRPLALGLYVLVGVTVFFAVQAAGVVLASALFVLAPLAALLWVKRFETLLWLSVLISAAGTFVGATWSAIDEKMPTGAAIISILFLLFLASWFFSPLGYLKNYRSQRESRDSRFAEDLLKAWYYFYEANNYPAQFRLVWSEAYRRMDITAAAAGSLRRRRKLLRGTLAACDAQGYSLNEEGQRQATLLVRRHRLWEAYLVQKMGIRADHVHENAEKVEHFIGDDLELRIEAEVGTLVDPHGKPIPSLNVEADKRGKNS